MLPAESDGARVWGRVRLRQSTSTLAGVDASVAMVYLMHVLGAATIGSAPSGAAVGRCYRKSPLTDICWISFSLFLRLGIYFLEDKMGTQSHP